MKENSLLDSINKKKKEADFTIPLDIEGADMTPDDRPMFEYPEEKERRWEPDLNKQDINTLVAGATPMLVGLLTGNTGDALDVASAGIMKQEEIRREDEKSLISYLQKRSIANQKASQTGGKKRYQNVNYEDEDGAIRQGVFDTFTGEMKRSDGLAGYRKTVKKDPKEGELATFSGATGRGAPTVIEGAKPTRYTVKEEKDVKEVRKAFLSDKQVQVSKKAIDTSEKAIEILVSMNPVGDEAMKTVFPRMFGEVGNLAAAEQDRFAGSQQATRTFNRLRNKYENGLLTSADRADLIELAQIVAEVDKRKLGDISENYARTESRITGLNKEDISDILAPIARQEAGFSDEKANARMKRIKELKAKIGK